MLKNAQKKYVSQYYQLKVGYEWSNRNVSGKDKKEKNILVLVIQGVYIVSQAFVCQILEVEKKKRKLIRRLKKEEVTQLTGLLANKKTVTLLLKYLKTTKIGAKEEKRAKKQKQKKKNDKVGEKLLR